MSKLFNGLFQRHVKEMSSSNLNLREDLKTVLREYRKIDPSIRFIDKMIFSLVLLFAVNFLVVTVAKETEVLTIKFTPANMGLMIFPLVLAGLLMFVRMDIGRAANKGLKKETKDSILKKSILDLTIGGTAVIVLLIIVVLFPY